MSDLDPILKAFKLEKRRIAREAVEYKVRSQGFASLLVVLRRLPSFEDIEKMEVGWCGDQLLVTLKNPKSSLIRELVVATGVRAVKSPSYGGESLTATLTFPDELVVIISKYKPESCVVLYEDVLIPSRVEKRAKVVCNPPNDGGN